MKLKFLGTGGGRYVTGEQLRNTAGIVVKTEQTQLHLDPGPGALVYNHELVENPLETEAVIVSHAHPDHANDAEAIIEMMTEVGKKPGAVFANETCLRGYGDIEKTISNYHTDLCKIVETLDDTEIEFRDLTIRTQRMFHSDPLTQGLILEDENHTVGFWTDTEYSDELTEFYEGCDVLVVYCTLPRGRSIANHTSVSDVPDIVERIEPNTVIVTHFGYSFLNEDMDEQKEWLDEQIEPKLIFADDGMQFPGDAKLTRFAT